MRGDRRDGRGRYVQRAVLAAALVLLALLFAQLGPARILTLMAALGGNFAAIVLLFLGHECARAAALRLCMPPADRPPYRRLLRVRLLGEAVGTLTRAGTFAAEPARAVLLAGQTGSGAGAYGASVSELIANSMVSAAVTVAVVGLVLVQRALHAPGAPHGPILVLSHVLWWSSLVYLAGAIVALTTRVRVIGAAVRGLRALPVVGRRLDGDPVRVRAMEDTILAALSGRSWRQGKIAALELLAQAILIAEIFWAVRSMGVAIEFRDALFLEVLMKAPNLIQFVGVTEAGYAAIFEWLGMTAVVGFTLSLVKLLRSVSAAALGVGIIHQFDRVGQRSVSRWGGDDRIDSRDAARLGETALAADES